MRFARSLPLFLVVVAVALSGCGDRGLGPDSVARAGDLVLGVEETAGMIAPVGQIPPDPEVVEAVTDFWIEYTLLAYAVNREGELDRLDLAPLLEQEEMQLMISALREQVVRPDSVVSDDEIRRAFEEERMGEQVRARHILLFFPEGATPAQTDSVRTLAVELRERALAGESFAALAEEYSEDLGSAAEGGDLGFFSRGDLVPSFEDVAFDLETGEVSEVVETDFGLHVILLEERRSPEFEQVQGGLRVEIQRERIARAESIYIANLEGPADVQIAEDAERILREIAGDPEQRLGRRAADRPLTTFEGGSLTAGEFQEFVLNQPTQVRQQIATVPSDQVEELLRTLTRDELLLRDARERGITVDPSQLDEIEGAMRQEYLRIAQFLELSDLQPGEGESLDETIDRVVKDLMVRLVRGERDLAPLGSLAIPLRNLYAAETSRSGLETTAARILELRREEGVGDLFGPPGGQAPPPGLDAPGDEPLVPEDDSPVLP